MNHPDRAAGVTLVTDHPAYRSVVALPEVEDNGEIDEVVVVLEEREYAGCRVELRWNRTRKVVSILVEDEHGLHETPVNPMYALDAFRHPYAYLGG